MRISIKLFVAMLVLMGVTASSIVVSYLNSKKFEVLSHQLQANDQMSVALTDFRAASRQITVEAYRSAYFSRGSERADFQEATKVGAEKLASFQKLAPNVKYRVGELTLNFNRMTGQLLAALNAEKSGHTFHARDLMQKTIEDFFLGPYLGLIQVIRDMIDEEDQVAHGDYDQTARNLSFIFPAGLLLILGTIGMLLLPLTVTIKKKFDLVLTQMNHIDFEKNIFPELPVSGRDEFSALSMRFNEVTGKLRDSKRLILSQQQELIHSSRLSSLGEMAAGVAHEINNPLTIINGKIWQLKKMIGKAEFESSAHAMKSLEILEKTSERIAKIVSGLRTFARDGEADGIVEVCVQGVIEETLGFCLERFKNHGIALSASCASDLKVHGRPVQLGQVLLNLLNNAHDAVYGTPEPWVKIESKVEGASLFIFVTDSGKGIPKELTDKIMQPFFTTKPVGSGTGLGLSISQGIIKKMQGEFGLVKDSPHTQFFIRLPMLSEVSSQNQAS